VYEFRLPDLGEGIHEGEILEWHVAPGDAVRETAAAWAAQLAALPSAALRATKRAVLDGLDLPLHEGLALERRVAAGVAAGASR